MIMIAIASVCLQVASLSSLPRGEGTIDWQSGEIVLTMHADKREVKVVLDSGHPNSIWNTTSPPASFLRFGDLGLGSFRFSRTQISGADAFLCMDALSKWAIGIDVVDNKLTIWQGGSLSDFEAKKWTMSGPNYNPSSRITSQSLPLQFDNGIPHFSVKNQGQASKPVLLLQVACSVVRGHTIGGVPLSPGLCSFESGVEIGDVPVPWFQRIFRPDKSQEDYSAWGSFSLENFASPRVLVNFSARKLFYQRYPDSVRASFLLSEVEALPFIFSPGKVQFGGPMSHAFPDASELIGSDLVKIADVPGNQFADKVLNPSPESAQFLTHLFAKLTKGYTVAYRKDGKESSYVVDPG